MSFFMWKPDWKKLLGRYSRGLKDTIKINLEKIGWKGVDWIRFPQVRDK
jgi:hypothetical protein